MARSIEFHEQATSEFNEVINWYAEKSITAAFRFTQALDAAIESICVAPNRFVRTYSDCQVCRLKSFPYCVIYYQTQAKIFIVAVAHAKRRPGYWHNRV